LPPKIPKTKYRVTMPTNTQLWLN